MQLTLVQTKNELQALLNARRKAGKRVALVPTMGALHDGHLSLIELAKEHADSIVVSIFVNPTQFGVGEDFETYPRSLEDDMIKLTASGVDICYAPTAEEMYPEGFATRIDVTGASEGLCGKTRPEHFSGVATVAAKLLLQAKPHVAVFGEKDYQQLCVIRRMAADLDINTAIIGAPILREEGGLAMSSRNAYLSAEQRQTATALSSILHHAAERLKSAPDNTLAILSEAKEALLAAGFDKVDYVELCTQEDLIPLTTFSQSARLLAAAHLGTTRLIDNLKMDI